MPDTRATVSIMRLLAISIVAIALFACQNPAMYEPSGTVNESAPAGGEQQEEQQWQPDAYHVYIVDDTVDRDEDAIIDEYVADCDSDYYWILDQAESMCDSHNQEYPDEPRAAIGGGVCTQ